MKATDHSFSKSLSPF